MSVLSSIFKAVKSAGTMNGVNIAMSGYFGIDAYQEAKQEGSSTVGALGSGISSAALPFVIPGGIFGYLGFELATSAPGLAVDGYRELNQYRRKLRQQQQHKAFQDVSFQENQQTYTMRQAAMAIAARSRYNTDIALQGKEAKYMFK